MQTKDIDEHNGSELRFRFLDELGQATRALTQAVDVMAVTARALGEHLGATRCAYADVEQDSNTFTIRNDWTRTGTPSSAGRYSLDLFGEQATSNLRQGKYLVVRDVDAELGPAGGADMFNAIGIKSIICAGLVKHGRLVAMMAVHQSVPRDWTRHEIALVSEVVERCWAHIERVRDHEMLRESEARFRTIADAMPQMVWSTLPDGFHDYYNQQWYDFTGAPPESTDGDGWNGMFHPEDQPHAWKLWRHSLETGEVYEIEYRLRHRSGQYRWVLGRALPVRNEAGVIVRWMGTCTDIDEQKKVREELLANNRRKDEFLAMLAHELRNPLAPINTAAHLLKAMPADVASVKRSADIIGRQVRHMTELVDDLLDVSRVTRGLVELGRAPVDLKSVLGSAIEQARPLIEACGHQLTTRMAAGDVLVLGDRTRLVQVMSNLLNNAAKYTPANGAVWLTVSVGDEVEVCVADNGMGIEAQLLPQVFELFTQGERTPDRAQGGLGLGLALVRSLVELHGGRVTAASEGRGKGSSFTVRLPRLEMAAAPTAFPAIASPQAHPASRRLRVMVVDDNRDAAETLCMLLESLGHEVRVIHHPRQALAALQEGPSDVFILDIGLPEMDGYDLARQLRAHPNGRASTYIALTGYGGSQDKQRGVEAGFEHFVVKPADLGELERLIQLDR